MLNQLSRGNKFQAQAEQSILEALDSAQSAHQSVIQAQIGLTMQEIEYAQSQIHNALHRIYQAQQYISPESGQLSAQLQAAHQLMLQEYQLFQ
jgi:hypothetical protein